MALAQIFSVLLVSFFVSASFAQMRKSGITKSSSSHTSTTSTASTATTSEDAEMSETEKTLEELRKKAEARKKGQSTSKTSTTTPTRVNKNRGEVKVEEVKTVEVEKSESKKPTETSDQTETQDSNTSTSETESSPTTAPSDPTADLPTVAPTHPFGVFIHYSLLDLVVPSKYGIGGYVDYRGRQIEAEYLTGSISVPLIITDIGEIKDTRFTVRIRNFAKNGRLNWFWGVTYFAFDARLGAELLNSVTPGQAFPDYDIAEHRALGFDIGFGHRWELAENFVFGVDWISWAQPLTTFKKDAPFLGASAPQELKDRVEKAIGLMTYVPRFSVAKISLGYVF